MIGGVNVIGEVVNVIGGVNVIGDVVVVIS